MATDEKTPAKGKAEASSDVEVKTDANARADLSTGQGVGDVEAKDVPNALEGTNLPPEVRAELVRNHPVTPGAQPAPVTQREQPMPVVTGAAADGAGANDRPIVRYQSSSHPELVVWHPNGERTIQFHNGEFATANEEWQAVLERVPEVSRLGEDREVPQGMATTELEIDAKGGHVTSLVGADVDPVRVDDIQGAASK